MPHSYQVTAVPLDPNIPIQYLIECSECGPVGSITAEDPGPFVIDHIKNHTIQPEEQT